MADRADYREVYAVSSWMLADRSLDDALKAIAAAGFKWVEIWADQTHLDPRLGTDVGHVKALVRKLGLRVHSIHTPFNGLNIGLPDRGQKAEWLKVIGASLQASAELQSGVAVVHVASHHQDLASEELYAASREITGEFVAELGRQARGLGISLALENLLGRAERRFGNSLQELAAFFSAPDMGFCLDTGHAAVNGFDVYAEIRAAGDRLLSIHVDSNDGRTDLHWPPDRGVIDWPQIKRCLSENGYQGLYVLELHGGEHADLVLQAAAEFAARDA